MSMQTFTALRRRLHNDRVRFPEQGRDWIASATIEEVEEILALADEVLRYRDGVKRLEADLEKIVAIEPFDADPYVLRDSVSAVLEVVRVLNSEEPSE